jgi:hypothetical protein
MIRDPARVSDLGAMTRELSRQAFIRGSPRLITVRLITCGALSPAAASTGAAPRDWGALAKSISGRVILPDKSDYGAAKKVFNARLDGSTPVAVIAARSTGDVEKGRDDRRENDIKVAARGGGHSYIGDSAASGTTVIDLRQLSGGTAYDVGSALGTISAGTDLNSVQIAVHGRSIPTGSCPTVGVAGLTLGGGPGADARLCGLTCDALVCPQHAGPFAVHQRPRKKPGPTSRNEPGCKAATGTVVADPPEPRPETVKQQPEPKCQA